MVLKFKLYHYFFLAIILFIALSWLSTFPTIQKIYYPFFEQLSLESVSRSQEEVYFKTRLNADNLPNNPDQIVILFNSKKYLTSLLKIAEKTKIKSAYGYKGFIIYISETYISPLIFFLSLMIVTPNNIKMKILTILIGAALIIGFAYISVRFRGLTLVADAELKDLEYLPRQKEFYKLIAYSFSNVAAITVATLLWGILGLGIRQYYLPYKS